MKKRNPTGKTYEIDSFEKLINVIDEDNFEALTLDLLNWLAYTVKISKAYREEFPKQCKGKSNWDLFKSSFIWTDDGQVEINKFQIKNGLTGEVVTIKRKP